MKGVWKGIHRYVSKMFVKEKEAEIQIGGPTDVKHVAHIGWDGPTVNPPSWMDDFKGGDAEDDGPGDTPDGQPKPSNPWEKGGNDKSERGKARRPKKGSKKHRKESSSSKAVQFSEDAEQSSSKHSANKESSTRKRRKKSKDKDKEEGSSKSRKSRSKAAGGSSLEYNSFEDCGSESESEPKSKLNDDKKD